MTKIHNNNNNLRVIFEKMKFLEKKCLTPNPPMIKEGFEEPF